jgi:hypothetical protein
MKLVYPVTSQNAPLYKQLSLLFEKLGPHSNHEVVLVTCPSTIESAQLFAESIKRLFRDVTVVTMPSPVGTSVKDRNDMFRVAAETMAAGTGGWIWMEHATPCDRGWLDVVDHDYNGLPADRPFMGCIEDTYFYATDPVTNQKIIGDDGEPRFRKAGQHMRFGVYPADFALRSKLMKFMTGSKPFEIFLQDEIVYHCHTYPKFATVWYSRNFEGTSEGGGTNGGYVRGEQTPGVESEIRKPGNSVNYRNNLVIHGCRDGSLGFIITRRHFTGLPDAVDRAKNRAENALSVAVTESTRAEELEQKLADVEAKLLVADIRNNELEADKAALQAEVDSLSEQITTNAAGSDDESVHEQLAAIIHERDAEIAKLKLQLKPKKPGRKKAVA